MAWNVTAADNVHVQISDPAVITATYAIIAGDNYHTHISDPVTVITGAAVYRIVTVTNRSNILDAMPRPDLSVQDRNIELEVLCPPA